MAAESGTERGARVIFIPPPLYYIAGFVVGLVLDALVDLPIGGRPVTTVIGGVLAVLGFAFAQAGVFAVLRNKTTMVPHHPVSTLVTTGAYRWSRNPMYTGLAILYLGGALLVGSWWLIVLLPLVMLAVTTLVIRPEERYLSGRFGPEYAAYRAHVRRWL